MNYIYINLYKTSLKGVVRAEWGKLPRRLEKSIRLVSYMKIITEIH